MAVSGVRNSWLTPARNSFLDSPEFLSRWLAFRARPTRSAVTKRLMVPKTEPYHSGPGDGFVITVAYNKPFINVSPKAMSQVALRDMQSPATRTGMTETEPTASPNTARIGENARR